MTEKRASAVRIAAFVGMFVLTTALIVGAGLLLATHRPEVDGWLILALLAVGVTLTGPLVLGAVLTFWDMDRSLGARRIHRNVLWIVVGIQVLATVMVAVYSAVTGAAWWWPAVFAGTGIVLTAVAARVGPALRRAEERSRGDEPASPGIYTRAEFRRDMLRLAWAAVIAFAVTAIGVGALIALLGVEFWWLLAWPGLFAVLAVSVGCSLAVIRLGRRQRDAVGGDLGKLREIAKVVVRMKDIPLSDEDEIAASRFAQVSWVTQAYQLASTVCGYISLIFLQAVSVGTGVPIPFAAWLVGTITVALVVLVSISVVQLRRTRRYALAHRHLVG
jgi:hypothetical protein